VIILNSHFICRRIDCDEKDLQYEVLKGKQGINMGSREANPPSDDLLGSATLRHTSEPKGVRWGRRTAERRKRHYLSGWSLSS
jgi:hypothetical protein